MRDEFNKQKEQKIETIKSKIPNKLSDKSLSNESSSY